MATGIECAGLVLAVLPPIVELAKAYPRGVKVIRDTVQPTRFDQELEEFYEELFCQLFEFHGRMQQIVEYLPNLSQTRKAELCRHFQERDWKPGTDVANAFAEVFQSPGELYRFEIIVKRVIRQVGQLVEDRSTYLSRADATTDMMYQKLKTFSASRVKGTADSNWCRRFRFSLKQKDRQNSILMVDKWNEKLNNLAANLDRSVAIERSSRKQRSMPPFAYIRQLASHLYNSLAAHWTCTCVQRRSAKFCLQSHTHIREEDERILFQLLLGRQGIVAPLRSEMRWYEGQVVVHDPAAHRMSLAVEPDGSSDVALWRQQADQCQLSLTETTRETTLAEILNDVSRNIRARSCIVVQLAHSLVQLYETAWLDKRWTKDQISFLEAAPSLVNLERPYVTVDFPQQASIPSTDDLSQFHENFGILSLGIVLIEMHFGRSFEELRIPEDLRGSSTIDCNALYRTADRLFDKIHCECSPNYEKAIKACLQIPWKVAGQPVSLLDESTRQEVWKHIIVPLEEDMEFLGGRMVA